MSINAIIDGTTYEGIQTILVGGKTITLNEVEDSGGGGGDEPSTYPAITYVIGGNPNFKTNVYGLVAGDYTVNRACAVLSESYNDAVAYSITGNTQQYPFPDPSYPLYIPNGATQITVNCPNLCCAINVHKDENGVATQIDSGSWSVVGGETNYDLSSFIAQGATHLSIGFKNSSSTSLAGTTIDSTTVQISFS